MISIKGCLDNRSNWFIVNVCCYNVESSRVSASYTNLLEKIKLLMLNTAGKKHDKMKHLERLSEFKGGGKILYQEGDYFFSGWVCSTYVPCDGYRNVYAKEIFAQCKVEKNYLRYKNTRWSNLDKFSKYLKPKTNPALHSPLFVVAYLRKTKYTSRYLRKPKSIVGCEINSPASKSPMSSFYSPSLAKGKKRFLSRDCCVAQFHVPFGSDTLVSSSIKYFSSSRNRNNVTEEKILIVEAEDRRQ